MEILLLNPMTILDAASGILFSLYEKIANPVETQKRVAALRAVTLFCYIGAIAMNFSQPSQLQKFHWIPLLLENHQILLLPPIGE